MFWLKIINMIRKRRNGGASSGSKKWIIILLLVAVVVGVIIAMEACDRKDDILDMARRATAGMDAVDNWETEVKPKNQGIDLTSFGNEPETQVYEQNSGGLGGLGYNFRSYVESSDETSQKHVQAQMLELLDFIGVEWNQPTTLFGLSLMEMETSFWDQGTKSYKDKEYDIYKFRSSKCRPSDTGAIGSGRVMHSGGYYNPGAFGLVQVEGVWADGSPSNDTSKTKDDLAVVNPDCGELKAVANSQASIEELISKIFGSFDAYIQAYNVNSVTNEVVINNFADFVKDVSNGVQNAFAISVNLATQLGGLPCSLPASKHDYNLWESGNHNALCHDALGDIPGIETKTLENLGEAGANVLAVEMSLWGWNEGSGNCTSSIKGNKTAQLRRLLLYDLAKYLSEKGASAMYDAGWHHMGNAVKGNLSDASAKYMEEDFMILFDILYPDAGQVTQRNAIHDAVKDFWDMSLKGTHSGFIYAIMGIIKAQNCLNNAAKAGIVAEDGTTPNVYSAVYRRTLNTSAVGIDGIIARALAAGEDLLNQNLDLCKDLVILEEGDRRGYIKQKVGLPGYIDFLQKEYDNNLTGKNRDVQYCQSLRWSASQPNNCNFFDCSSFVCYMLYTAGLEYFGKSFVAANFADDKKMKQLIQENKISVVYQTSQTDYTAKGSMSKADLKNICLPGDIILYNANSKDNGRYLGIDHAALYYGNGKLIESCPGYYINSKNEREKFYLKYANKRVDKDTSSGYEASMRGPGIFIREIYKDTCVVCVYRLTEAALSDLGYSGAVTTGAMSAGSGASTPYVPGTTSVGTGTVNVSNVFAGVKVVAPGKNNPKTGLPTYTPNNYVKQIEIPFDCEKLTYGSYSIIHSGSAYLYYPKSNNGERAWNGYVICVNAGHGTHTGTSYGCTNKIHGDSLDATNRYDKPYKKPEGYGTTGFYGKAGKQLFTFPNTRGWVKITDSGTNKGYFSDPCSDGASLESRSFTYTSYIDNATYTVNTDHERSANFMNGLVLRDTLLKNGFAVLMIRDERALKGKGFTNATVKDSYVQLDNVARTVLANQYADAHIALHYDSSESTESKDKAFFIDVPVDSKGNIKSEYKDVAIDNNVEYFEIDNSFGEILLTAVKAKGYACVDGLCKSSNDLTQTCFSTIPSVDIELGGKTSDRTEESIQKFCDGIAIGLSRYFKLT